MSSDDSAQNRTPSSRDSSRSASASASPATPTPAPRKTASGRKSLLSNGSSKNDHDQELLAPKTQHTEFGGWPGALFVTTVVPFFSYALFFFCNEEVGCSVLPSHPKAIWNLMVKGVIESFTDWEGFAIYFGWYAFTVAAFYVLPGKLVEGSELRTGERLMYKTNAFATLVASLAITAGIIAVKGPAGFTFPYEHWAGMVSASIVNSLIQAFYVYAASFKPGRLLALGGNTGNALFDWFIGRELNPRIGSFDIKTFNELRPGLILWFLLDISCACYQYTKLNGRVTDSMLLVCAFQGWYVIDSLFLESAIFTQMDITTDGFGFMLSVGDLTWVPFTYGLQARYLAFAPLDLGLIASATILAINFTGYYIFRTSNEEKNQFRNGKNPKNLTSMKTSTGRQLLTSGWWGRSRHPNYFGDWTMAWAWCLPAGFSSPIPYFYVCFFATLLVHRQMRDDEACRQKYGKDWDKYCKLVKYRIIPYVY